MTITDLENMIKRIFPEDNRPIVIYSAIWPFAVSLGLAPVDIAKLIVDILMKIINKKQTLLMPSFCQGYVNGICNLDEEKSSTGLLTELFRVETGASRTLSAFFSFSVIGEKEKELYNLRAKHAWGEGSLYEFLHNEDAHILTFGTHPTHCSFTHRAEWLAKDVIKYRYEKKFNGTLIRDGKKINIEENLFVRKLNPLPQNDWTWLTKEFKKNGMRIMENDKLLITEMSARKKMDIIVPMIYNDPLVLIKNRVLFE